MYKILIFLFLLISGVSFSQSEPEDTIIERLQVYDGFDLPSNFKSQYRNTLRRVRRVYPLALEAARVIDSLDIELEEMNKNREQRKLMRQTHKNLKHDFKFSLKDLYISEGIILTKLIYRETGMTVRDIISKYKNGAHASVYTGLAVMFDQDLDAKYYPDTEDFIIECVIQDIISGKVDFDPVFKTLDKEEFKESKKEYRIQRKKNRKAIRKAEKESKKEKPQK
ncbi:MAG TPA: DUF4294 domain-containing protein [Brumimicrobium sp.]|nr:DUF4294 domain-containing protein [Brumimicrobium sp.]